MLNPSAEDLACKEKSFADGLVNVFYLEHYEAQLGPGVMALGN